MNSKGFTFIELLVTMTILSILAVLAIPCYIHVRNSSRNAVAMQNMSDVYHVAQLTFTEGYECVFLSRLEQMGFKQDEKMIVWVVDNTDCDYAGTENSSTQEGLTIRGYHIENSNLYYEVDEDGNITKEEQ